MKIVGIFMFILGYTMLYAGISRVQGKKSNTVLALLGFQDKTNLPLGGILAGAAAGAQALAQQESGSGSSGSGSPTPDNSGTTTPIPNASNGGSTTTPIPNYTGGGVAGPPIITGV